MRISTSLFVVSAVCASRFAAAQEPPPPSEPVAPSPRPSGVSGDAPPPVYAPPPALSPEPPPARPVWRPRDAHVAISVEHVLSFEAVSTETDHDTSGDGSYGDFTTTRTNFPFSANRRVPPRLAVDVLFGGTVGAFFGLSRTTNHSVSYDPVLGKTESPEIGGTGGVAGLRGGAIVGQGSIVALWLRGGVGLYWSADVPADDGASWTEVFVALDPVLIVAPARHVALTVGPYLEGGRGSSKHKTMGVVDPGEHTWVDFSLSFATNLSVMF